MWEIESLVQFKTSKTELMQENYKIQLSKTVQYMYLKYSAR